MNLPCERDVHWVYNLSNYVRRIGFNIPTIIQTAGDGSLSDSAVPIDWGRGVCPGNPSRDVAVSLGLLG